VLIQKKTRKRISLRNPVALGQTRHTMDRLGGGNMDQMKAALQTRDNDLMTDATLDRMRVIGNNVHRQ
jgi:hypothetical protein